MYGEVAYEEIYERKQRAKKLESPWSLTNLLDNSISSYGAGFTNSHRSSVQVDHGIVKQHCMQRYDTLGRQMRRNHLRLEYMTILNDRETQKVKEQFKADQKERKRLWEKQRAEDIAAGTVPHGSSSFSMSGSGAGSSGTQ